MSAAKMPTFFPDFSDAETSRLCSLCIVSVNLVWPKDGISQQQAKVLVKVTEAGLIDD